MSRVIAVVEGRTEQTFVREVLGPWLATLGVYLDARLVGKPGHKGGAGDYQRSQRDILALLKQESSTTITTMFDFFRMPEAWPGRQKAANAAHAQKASIVENAIVQDVSKRMGGKFDPSRFIPYVQMYEFEALLFTRPEVIGDVLQNAEISRNLRAIRNQFKTPEEIDDNPETAPSKRIEKLSANYVKPLHGTIAAQRIGIDSMLGQCPHFQEWLAKLQGTARQAKK